MKQGHYRIFQCDVNKIFPKDAEIIFSHNALKIKFRLKLTKTSLNGKKCQFIRGYKNCYSQTWVDI